MKNTDELIEQLFNTASELMEVLGAVDFELSETDELSDKEYQIKIVEVIPKEVERL